MNILKITSLLFVSLLFSLSSFAQPVCTPDTSLTEVGFSPTDSLLPCIERGVYYEQVIQFKNADTLDGALVGFPGVFFPIESIQIINISNVPSGLSYQCSDPSCTVLGGESACLLVTGTTTDPAGDYNLGVTANVTIGGFAFPVDSATLASAGLGYKLTVIDSGANCPNTAVPCVTQDIPLSLGWNMISSYINPDDPDVLNIFSEISADIIIIKNALGQALIPSLGINGIGNWSTSEGYKVKTSGATTLTMGCEQIEPSTHPISLSSGWSIISYLRTSPMSVLTALSGISANILLVKDINGDSYIPAFGINTIGDMEPGQGYKIKMSNADTLTYPSN